MLSVFFIGMCLTDPALYNMGLTKATYELVGWDAHQEPILRTLRSGHLIVHKLKDVEKLKQVKCK